MNEPEEEHENQDVFSQLNNIDQTDKVKFMNLIFELMELRVFFRFSTGFNDDGHTKTYMAIIQIMVCDNTIAMNKKLEELGVKSSFDQSGWWLYV
jgi:hypothetical protein